VTVERWTGLYVLMSFCDALIRIVRLIINNSDLTIINSIHQNLYLNFYATVQIKILKSLKSLCIVVDVAHVHQL
jgi:hypothetical protein